MTEGGRGAGRLILCPTPIGNLDDVTPRHREVLAGADVLACEDTRTTGKLLERLGIVREDGKPRLVSYHDNNEAGRSTQLVNALLAGESVVVVSDAGTPAIADPGYRVVRAAREAGLEVTVLAGPNAAVMAVAGSGLPTDRWVFEGFAPPQSSGRVSALERSRDASVTVVYYESPHRIVEFLSDVVSVYGAVTVCVARELTKLHEEWLFGTAEEVHVELAGRDRQRGEFVVVVGPAQEAVSADDVDRWIAAMWAEGVSPKQIKAIVSAATGMRKSEVWERLERLK